MVEEDETVLEGISLLKSIVVVRNLSFFLKNMSSTVFENNTCIHKYKYKHTYILKTTYKRTSEETIIVAPYSLDISLKPLKNRFTQGRKKY